MSPLFVVGIYKIDENVTTLSEYIHGFSQIFTFLRVFLGRKRNVNSYFH